MPVSTIKDSVEGALFSKASQALIHELSRAPGRAVNLALPGGRSIVPLLRTFVQDGLKLGEGFWSRLQLFMVDERLVSLDDSECNFRLIRTQLAPVLESGLLNRTQLHPFIFDEVSHDHGVRAYETELKRHGGQFDVAIVGVGEDGHIAALFPEHHSVRNDNPLFITMSDSPKPPAGRMSASRALIEKTPSLFALFIGEGKRDAWRRYRDESLGIEQCPAKLVNAAERGYVVTDLLD